MYKINQKTMRDVVNHHINARYPVMVYGGFGVGKSEIIKQVCFNKSKTVKKKYKLWNKCSEVEKVECEKNKSKHFIVFEETLSEYDVTDLKGLFDLDNKDYCSFVTQRWVNYVCDSEAWGVIFLDELTNTDESVQKSAYRLIHDRTIGDRKISDGIAIVCAGNREEDNSGITELSYALRDRMAEYELQADPTLTIEYLSEQEWCNFKLLSFFKYRPDRVVRVGENNQDKSTTPRGIERTMRIIGKDTNPLECPELIKGNLGEIVGAEIIAFLKQVETVDLDNILKKPKTIKTIKEISTKYSVIVAISERYREDKKLLNTILDIVLELEPEFAILMLRLCVEYHEALLVSHLETTKTKKDEKIMSLVEKYLG